MVHQPDRDPALPARERRAAELAASKYGSQSANPSDPRASADSPGMSLKNGHCNNNNTVGNQKRNEVQENNNSQFDSSLNRSPLNKTQPIHNTNTNIDGDLAANTRSEPQQPVPVQGLGASGRGSGLSDGYDTPQTPSSASNSYVFKGSPAPYLRGYTHVNKIIFSVVPIFVFEVSGRSF